MRTRRKPAGRYPPRLGRSMVDGYFWAVHSGHIDFAKLATRLDCDETEAEARYEQWLTESGTRDMDDFFRELGL